MTDTTVKAEEVLRRELDDASFRTEWERTAFARAVVAWWAFELTGGSLSIGPWSTPRDGAVGDCSAGSW